MKKLFREPLVHFLVGGALLFALYGEASGPGAGRPDLIVVSEDRVAMLVQSFERTWMRPPAEAELKGLIDDFVTEEVLYREALALGLDRDDLIVRRRMRQKMEFLNDGLSEREPDEEDLRAFLEANPERFLVPSRVRFVQVFVNPELAGSPEQRAARLLAQLGEGEAAAGLGDATLLPRGMNGATPREVAGTYGAPFAEALAELPVGAWTGPVASSFGLHVVRVAAREPSRLPALPEVRDAVAREWAAEQRTEARDRFYDSLRARYEVEIRVPAPPVPPAVADQP
jgi:hypothetical protein